MYWKVGDTYYDSYEEALIQTNQKDLEENGLEND